MLLERFRVLFGHRLRFLRQLESLTQAELAEKAGISLEHVNKIERGAAAPSMASVIGLAQALETEPANLFLFSDSPMAEAADLAPKRSDGEPAVDWTKFVTRIGTWERNMVTGTTTWSDSLFRLLGFEPDEVEPSGTILFHLTHPDDRERLAASMQRIDNGQRVEKLEYRIRHKAGGWRRLLAHAEVEFDDQGQATLVLGTVMDVTEQRRLQQALLDSHTTLERQVQERTRHLQDIIMRLGEEIRQRKRVEEALKISDQIVSSTADAMCMVDRRYVYRAVNDSYVRRTGLRREDILDRHVAAILGHEAFGTIIKPHMDRALDGELVHYSNWYDLPGQGRCCLDMRYFPCRNDVGDIVGTVVNVRDITQREQAQQALRESEELHRTIYERANMGILRIDNGGRILEANRQTCMILDRSENDLHGRLILELCHPDDRDMTLASLQGILNGTSDSAQVEKRLLRPDGSYRTCFTALSAVRDTSGDLDFLITTITDITERKRTEENLQVYRQMVSSSSDVMVMLDRDHTYRAVNKTFSKWFGMDPKEVIGLTPEHVSGHEIYQASIKPRLDACLAGKELHIHEWREFPMLGRRHTDMTYIPCRDGKGKIMGALIIARDDTESHKALLNLQESERNYRLLFDNIRDAIFLHELRPDGAHGPFLDVNQVACRITGYTRDELLSHTPMILNDSKIYETVVRDAIAQLNDKGHALFEFVLIAKDGRRVPIEIHSLLFTRKGKRLVLSVARDITQRKEAEAAMDESEARLRQMFEAAGDAICVHDLEGRILDANRACHDRLGYTREEMLAMRVSDIDAPETAALIPDRIAQLLRDGQGTFEVVHMHKDGTSMSAEASTRIVEHQGRRAIISVARDMSEHHRLEAELRRASLDAEEASQAKSGFLAAMSHEIRTPLNSLMGMLDLARMADDSAERDDCLNTARESAGSLLRIISDVLDLSRIEAGKTDICVEAADPREALEFAARLFARQASGKGLNLAVKVAESVPPRIVFDCGRLKQILVNLVGNAIKCTVSGGVLIRLDAEPTGPDQMRMRLEVEDTGPGIPESILETVFEPFTRGPQFSRDTKSGAGLGLSIVKKLAEAMNARIELDSVPDRGTVVGLEFTAPVAQPIEEPAQPPLPPRSTARLRVLVAEDDPVNRMTACKLLEKLGHEVEGVEDGSVVLDMLRNDSFDLVFMDVEMPGMDGLEATRRIRTSRSGRMRSDVPVVAMTAHALKGDRERFLKAGMNDYIAKPVNMDALAEMLLRVGENNGIPSK